MPPSTPGTSPDGPASQRQRQRRQREANEELADKTVAVIMSCLAWVALVLGVLATVGPWWAWGQWTSTGSGYQNPMVGVQVATSPWMVTYPWTQLPQGVGALCPGCPANIDVVPVYWSQLNSQNACNASSLVFRFWANPLGLCSASGAFSVPSTPLAMQGLLVSATVFLAIVAMASCCDIAMDKRSHRLAAVMAFLMLLSWVLYVAAFSLFSAWTWTQQLVQVGGSFVPVWLPPAAPGQPATLSAVPARMVIGASLGLSVATFVAGFALFTYYACIAATPNVGEEQQQPQEPVQEAPAAAGTTDAGGGAVKATEGTTAVQAV